MCARLDACWLAAKRFANRAGIRTRPLLFKQGPCCGDGLEPALMELKLFAADPVPCNLVFCRDSAVLHPLGCEHHVAKHLGKRLVRHEPRFLRAETRLEVWGPIQGSELLAHGVLQDSR